MDSKKKKRKKVPVMWVSDLLHRFFEGKANEEEKEKIKNWDPRKVPAIYSASDQEIKKGVSRVWKMLHTYLSSIPAEHKTAESKISIAWKKYKYLSLAASVALLIGIASLLTYTYTGNAWFGLFGGKQLAIQKISFSTAEFQQRTVRLPDGSVLHLNANTRLYIDENDFDKKKREIWLVEGEAFFKVAKDIHKPFIIHSDRLETIVRGTEFNIRSYSALKQNIVSVKSGRVEILSGGKRLGLFTKNKQLVYDKKTNVYESENYNWEDAASWMEHKLVLHNASVEELKFRLKQVYGIELEVKDNALSETSLINTSFPESASADEVLLTICTVYGAKYQLTNNKHAIIY